MIAPSVADPDSLGPHYFWKLDPDPGPDHHQSEKQGPDLHQSQNRIQIRIKGKIQEL
jgi:hypothetical protein